MATLGRIRLAAVTGDGRTVVSRQDESIASRSLSMVSIRCWNRLLLLLPNLPHGRFAAVTGALMTPFSRNSSISPSFMPMEWRISTVS